MSIVPFVLQLTSLWQAVTGDGSAPRKKQQEFLDACKKYSGRHISEMTHTLPIVGHVKGVVHLALGDTETISRSEDAPTRTLMVLGSGALTAGTGDVAVPILGGVATGNIADSNIAITGSIDARHQIYNPQGDLGAVSEHASDWRGGVFDIVALGVGDVVLSVNGALAKATSRTTKVFRVEGEGVFLTERGMAQYSANNCIFPGPGGSTIESPNIVATIVRSKDRSQNIVFRRPSKLYMNIGDTSHSDKYYEQKLFQYDEAVEQLRHNTGTDTLVSHPAARRFTLQSFRILTNDAKCMFRYIPENSDGNINLRSSDIRRIDITRTSASFECSQPIYVPVIANAIPDTYSEELPTWLHHMPTRLSELMRDDQITYGCVRTFVVFAPQFSRRSLRADIALTITDQELKRLEHAPVSLSTLSPDGVDSIKVRQEPVRRLCQSRQVKCGRRVLGDVDHGRHTEYLAELSDGSTFWVPSCNVAEDLKQEFWKVMTTGAKEVAEFVNSDPSTGKVTVKRPDGTTEIVQQTQIFWQEESEPTRLTDMELEALLHHGHFGLDVTEFVPCTASINTDWAKVEVLSKGAAIMKDTAASKAGEYDGIRFDVRSISLSKPFGGQFVSRTIPFFIASNSTTFDIKVTHGYCRTATTRGDGNVVLNLHDERFESGADPHDTDHNLSEFHIRPIITCKDDGKVV
ncbi:uncharacterized protein B0H18DRAFT_1010797 [Fomitopsis serialis]|uniref:uncharacterized protein n=1 Tax=Fomitopsis serialis TaxID=139415 RepID=UPI002008B7F3|nr:uncharacterized protein B0H18DRAFT_1010797 [Neoantrodia serialis]KAH9924923.1 hypothetical protein B0H18DRAFT_1010797 [Neoantrodia serialis]